MLTLRSCFNHVIAKKLLTQFAILECDGAGGISLYNGNPVHIHNVALEK